MRVQVQVVHKDLHRSIAVKSDGTVSDVLRKVGLPALCHPENSFYIWEGKKEVSVETPIHPGMNIRVMHKQMGHSP